MPRVYVPPTVERGLCRRPQVIPLLVLVMLSVWGLPQSLDRAGAAEEVTLAGDIQLRRYWQVETEKLGRDLGVTRADWEATRARYEHQLQDMLGLQPWPPRTPLQAVVTGTAEAPGVRVERLHFQSRPGLYVTANLYLPANGTGPYPAVLYLCGHGAVKLAGVSYGNKVHYQHHGVWLARQGYVCLMLDSLQLGEIEGVHHGTHHLNQWWWLNRGYTPAGVEAWNCIRALDYLQLRPEVDGKRLGVSGRSGGGAYSWWVAALDARVQAAVPVAGITDMQNHIVDGCVDGHCDCMYFVNTYQWDFPRVAALVAPRPLLIANTDRDSIFPLDGVARIHQQVRSIYRLYEAEEKLGLQISAGPHVDSQELQVAAFRWLDQHLQQREAPLPPVERNVFAPHELKVFAGNDWPADQTNTRIAETFVEEANEVAVPTTAAQWNKLRHDWSQRLREETFRAWPTDELPLDQQLAFDGRWGEWRIRGFHLQSQAACRIPWVLIQNEQQPSPRVIDVWVLHEGNWEMLLEAIPSLKRWSGEAQFALPDSPAVNSPAVNSPATNAPATAGGGTDSRLASWLRGLLPRPGGGAVALVLPRGIGPTAPTAASGTPIQVERRYYLLGQTADGGRIWDVRRALHGVRQVPELAGARCRLLGQERAAGWALFAALFEPDLTEVVLDHPPANYREGPTLLNISRFLRWEHVVALVADRVPVRLMGVGESLGSFATALAHSLGRPAESMMIGGPEDAWQTIPQVGSAGRDATPAERG